MGVPRNRRWVYFIKPIGLQGPIKIGCSVSPDRRRETLECWAPFPLEVVAEIAGDMKLERRFHAQFATDWRGHEWFTWSRELQATIDAVRAGTFNVETLPPPQVRKSLIKRKPWTEESKRRASWNRRIWAVQHRTGYRPPYHKFESSFSDPATITRAEAYIAEPHLHGEAINAPWAKIQQKLWLSRLEKAAA